MGLVFPVNVRYAFPMVLSHQHVGAVEGPNSRPHSHFLRITVEFSGLKFDPATGAVVEPNMAVVEDIMGEYPDKSLDEIYGIRPTFSSLALSMRERLLYLWPETSVTIACLDEGWEVQT